MLDVTDPRRPSRAAACGPRLARTVRARCDQSGVSSKGQMRHGPRGAAEFARDGSIGLFGFAETTGDVPGRARAGFDLVYEAYVRPMRGVREFMMLENPAAAARAHRGPLRRPARRRGLWQSRGANDVDAGHLAALRLEGRCRERAASPRRLPWACRPPMLTGRWSARAG